MPGWVSAFLIAVAALVPAGVVFYVDIPGYLNHAEVVGTMQPAPGPIIGAGLPALLVAGSIWAYQRFVGRN
jgi:hypothetical protein